MKRLLLLVASFLLFSGFTFSWDPVTTYTDNTAITGKTVLYDAWVDGTKFLQNGTATSVTVPAPGSGVAHLYEVAAKVDNVSSVRAGLNWTSPLVTPAGPGNLRVVP